MTIQELKAKLNEKNLQIDRLKSQLSRKEREISFLLDLLDRHQLDEFEKHLKEVYQKED